MRKGCRFYEGLVRVPLIWRWPGHVRAGLHSDALVELTDIVPTLLDAAGLAPGRLVTGRTLLPLLTGGEQGSPHRDFVRAEFHDAQGLGGDGRRMSVATMFRDARWKLVVYHSHGVGELYDLDDDPDELVNLWDIPRKLRCRGLCRPIRVGGTTWGHGRSSGQGSRRLIRGQEIGGRA